MPENHEWWAVKTQVSIVYLQPKINEVQNDYLTQTMVFLAGIELKKKITPAWEDWINLYILRQQVSVRQSYKNVFA